jgi:SH3-like domain-containing protein
LQTVRRSNVREGPGTNFKVLFTMAAGTSVTGYSYTDNWIRVTAENGRAGWVMRNLVGRGPEAMR